MSKSINKNIQELMTIQVAIELDKGKNIDEVAEIFGIKISEVKSIYRKLASDNKQTKTRKTRHFTNHERELLVGRIGAGEPLEDICSEVGVTEITLKRWCKLSGVTVLRGLNQISKVEKREILELLDENNWREVASAYNTSINTIEQITTPPHSKLDTESLSFLFEILREQPFSSAKKISATASKAGLSIPQNAIISYKKRLKLLGII